MSEGDGKLIIKQFEVTVAGYGACVYEAASRGKALAWAWRSWPGEKTFGEFLSIASARACPPTDRFGERITVAGLPAFFVSCNRQYIRFVRPDSDIVLCSHPYDVEPPEARRGTPYYIEPAEPSDV